MSDREALVDALALVDSLRALLLASIAAEGSLAPSAPDRTGGWLRAKDVAPLYGMTVKAVYNWVDRGVLPALRLPGGDYRFSSEDLAEFDRRRRGCNRSPRRPAFPPKCAHHRRPIATASERCGSKTSPSFTGAPRKPCTSGSAAACCRRCYYRGAKAPPGATDSATATWQSLTDAGSATGHRLSRWFWRRPSRRCRSPRRAMRSIAAGAPPRLAPSCSCGADSFSTTSPARKGAGLSVCHFCRSAGPRPIWSGNNPQPGGANGTARSAEEERRARSERAAVPIAGAGGPGPRADPGAPRRDHRRRRST